jgi:DNA-binding CsgD family transcriptional regulator
MCIKLLNDINKDGTNSFPHLVVYAEDGEQSFLLAKSELWTIGRGGNNTIVLHDRWVSRHHATIQVIGQSAGRHIQNRVEQVEQVIVTTVDPPADPPADLPTDSPADLSVDQSTSIQATTTGENSQSASIQEAEPSNSASFYLVDLGSHNGSFVNGHYLTVPVTLKDGDRLTLGKTEIVFYKPVQPHNSPFLLSSDSTEPPTESAHRFNLTPSEEKVFREVVQGLTNKEIGTRLQISPRTVQTHLSSIMAKLNLENRSQIVRFAFERGYQMPNEEHP